MMKDYLTSIERTHLPQALQAAALWPEPGDLAPLDSWAASRPDGRAEGHKMNARNTAGWLAVYFPVLEGVDLIHVDRSDRVVLARPWKSGEGTGRVLARPWEILVSYDVGRPTPHTPETFLDRVRELVPAACEWESATPQGFEAIPPDGPIGLLGELRPPAHTGFFGRFRLMQAYVKPDMALVRLEQYVFEEREFPADWTP